MCPNRAHEDVRDMVRRGTRVRLVEANGQCYALAESIPSPSPPWGDACHDILVAIPAMYDEAALDAFYLAMPYTFNGGEHKRVKGDRIEVEGRTWQLVSWHYPDKKSWKHGQDSLDTHIAHCQGFFSHRGAVNDP